MTAMRKLQSHHASLSWFSLRTRLQQRWPSTGSLPYMRVLPRLWAYQWGPHR